MELLALSGNVRERTAPAPDPVVVFKFKVVYINKIMNSEFCKPVRRRGDTSLKLKSEWGRGPRQLT